ncbi:MAG: tetratricopeptide repeat protein [Bacteroidota bacterium]
MRIFIACCLSLFIYTSCIAGVFDVVRSLPTSQRFAQTQEIYNNQVKHKDSVFAISSIRQLMSIADELGDRPLQCLSISLLADQYARTRSANELSSQLHRDAIAMAERYRLPLMIGICNYRMGRYYYSFKNYPFAFEYLLRADNLFHELGYAEVPDSDEILFFIGSIYYETADYDKAETFLQNIQHLKKINGYIQKQSLNTLALIRRQQSDTAQALVYFQKTLDVAIAQRDSTWMGICYSNMGTLYFYSNHYETAYPMLEKAARLSVEHKQWGDAYGDLLFLARIDILQNRIAPALKKMDSALALQKFYFTPQARKHLYEAQALYYEKTNQQAKALELQHLLMQVKDSLGVSKDQQAYKKILLRMETEKHLNDIDKLEAEARASTLKRNMVILVLGLLVIVLLLVYSRNRLKVNSRTAKLEAEKLQAEEQLKNARQLLQNFTENTRQKNELIEQFSIELERLKGNMAGDPAYEERLKNFEKLVRSTILTDAEWNDFRKLFDKVHKGFFTRLEQKLSGLSVNDTRLMSLIKLGLNNLEMGNMMGMDADTIQQAKQRLREKIHPGQDGLVIEDLVQAI